MVRAFRNALAVAFVLVAAVTTAEAAGFRIFYAEPADLSFDSVAPGMAKPLQVRRIALRAFNRQFDLLVEDNSKLLREIQQPAGQGTELKLLRGSIEGVPDSWVRLTVENGQYSGAFWDGNDLYAIEPRHRVKLYLDVQVDSRDDAPLVYRLSDTQDALPPNYCGVKSPGRSGLQAGYKRLVSELKTTLALAGARDIEVSMVADSRFAAEYGNGATQELIRRMNIVDGIFDTQVGVNVVPTDFKVFAGNDDPFTGSNAELLLDKLSTYREDSAAIRARGLTHLITGTNLDGQTIGLAYLDSLCDSRGGASLSENQGAVLSSSLIIAHELGHNFGAEHDGETGSTCSGAPQTYLMSPYINGSSTFSGCSVTAMKAAASSAACVTPARTRDVAVSVPSSTVRAVINEPFDYLIDLSAVGQGDSHNIVVTASFSSATQVQSVSLPGAACRMTAQSAFCDLSELPAGTTQRMTIRMLPAQIGRWDSFVSVDASNESVLTNNRVDVPIVVSATIDASIAVTPSVPAPVVRQAFDVAFDITATGSQSIVDAITRIAPFRMQVLNVSSANGACADSTNGWSCTFGTIAPGQTRRVTVRAVAADIDYSRVNLELYSGGPSTLLDSAGFDLYARPEFDLRIDGLPSSRIVAIGDRVDIPLTISSNGTASVLNARMIIATSDSRIVRQLTGTNITCSDVGNLECSMGTLAPGTSVSATLSLSANSALDGYVYLALDPTTLDDNRGNNQPNMSLSVRPGSDVSIDENFWQTFQLFEGKQGQYYFTFLSKGATAPSNVTAVMVFPDSFQIASASMASGTGPCTVSAQTVSCSMPLMPASTANIAVTMAAANPGLHQAQLTVSATNDAVTTNNSRSYNLNVRPFVDAALSGPAAGILARVGVPVDVPLTVTNGKYTLSNASTTINVGPSIVIEAYSAGQGTCAQQNLSQVTCQLGTVQPNAVVPVNLRVRWTDTTSGIVAQFSAPDDSDSSNNRPSLQAVVDPAGDVGVQIAGNASVSAETGFGLPLPQIDVALSSARQPYIEFDFDPARLRNPSIIGLNASRCNWTIRPSRCEITDGLPSSTTETRRIGLTFTAGAVGATSVGVRVGARNDTNPGNDSQTVSVTITAATLPPTSEPTPAPPSGNDGKSGGGGGSFDALLLLLMCMAVPLVLLRRGFRSPADPAAAYLRSPCRNPVAALRAPARPRASPA